MLVVALHLDGPGNCAIVAGDPYVYARTATGSFVLPSRCPHRGGPLQLAALDGTGRFLRCPWHGRRTSVTRFRRHGVPAVRCGNDVTLVFDLPADASVTLVHTPVDDCLRRDDGADPAQLPSAGRSADAVASSSAQPRCSRRAHDSGTSPVRIARRAEGSRLAK